MNDLKLFADYVREHKSVIPVTVLAAFAGALLGVFAYYNSWLG